MDGVNNAYASAASSASAFINGQGSNQFIPNGPSTSGSASARKNDISIDVDISQKQQGNNKNNLGFNGFNGFNQFNAGKESGFSLEIGGANNLFKFVPNKGNMNEQEMHRHFSQYLQNMNGYGGSNQGYPAAQHGSHSHGHHQSGNNKNNKNDISIDLDISTNSKNQKVDSHGLPPQHGQNGYGLGFAASNGVDGINPAAPGAPGVQGILGNALGSVGSAASSLKDKLWGSKQTPPGSPSKDGEQKISLDIDLDTDGDGKADQKINVDIDQKDKDINRERNKLKSDHDAHMNEHDKGLKLKKKEKKQKIKNQKNKHVSNMSWSTTTNHYHPGQNPPPPSVVQIHLPPPMAMHHYNYPPPPPYHNAPPSTITHNSMNAAASSLSLQSTTVPSRPYANSHAAQMPGYGHGPSPPSAFYGQSNAVSGVNGIPSGVGAYGHADAAVNMQQGVPSYGNQHLNAPPSSYNHLNQVPNMHASNMQAPYNNNGVQNLYGQAPSAYHQQPQMGHQYSQTPYHH